MISQCNHRVSFTPKADIMCGLVRQAVRNLKSSFALTASPIKVFDAGCRSPSLERHKSATG